MKIQVNKKAINFKLQSTSGKVFNLSDVKNGLVVYFYPKDNTPGCTLETKDFSVLYKKFKAQGAVFAETFGWERAKWFDNKSEGEKYSFRRNNSFDTVAEECRAVRERVGPVSYTHLTLPTNREV